jgi:DNA ligase D-like protein (predicted ligase)
MPARFFEPMECLPVAKIPEGGNWTYEIKLDGYRLEAVKNNGRLTLYSRRGNDLTKRFHYITEALKSLPDESVIDGELVALDEQGRPSFDLLQIFKSAASHITFYAFDILVHRGENVMQRPLSERRAILVRAVHPSDHIGLSQVSEKTAAQMLRFVRTHGLEGIVAKRANSIYQPGKRTGYWTKTRINMAQEFVIGGYIPSHLGVDSIVVGFYKGKDLYYAARVRAGFVPATRRAAFEAIKHLKTPKCPFVNLPEKEPGRWGQGFTAEKMKEAVWTRPEAAAQIEFLEWTDANHLRHTKFVSLRDDKDPDRVVRETRHGDGAIRAARRKGLPAQHLRGDRRLSHCPGITSLHAGGFDLGTVACNCPCHKNPESEVPQ